MDDKTLQLLNAMAEKFGTTAEYLWGVLLKQAPITGVINALSMVAWIVAAVMWFRFVQRKTTTPAVTESERYPRAEWSEDVGVFFAWASVVVLFVFVAAGIDCGLPTVVAALFNPEYWALKQIWH